VNEKNLKIFYDPEENSYKFNFPCIFKKDGTLSTIYLNQSYGGRKHAKITCFHESCQKEEKYLQIENFMKTTLMVNFVDQAHNFYIPCEKTIRELLPEMLSSNEFEENELQENSFANDENAK
jgi:hypothetical protein